MDWEVLARFMAGESPADEADDGACVAGREDPARHDVLRALDRTLAPVAAPPAGPGRGGRAAPGARADGRARDARHPLPRPRPHSPPARRARTVPAPWLRAAAAVVLLLGAWFGVAGGARRRIDPRRLLHRRRRARLACACRTGRRVILGPASRLTFDGGYGKRTREVELRGEALFDVPHDDARPFTVHAGDAWVRDIGTTFSVEADSAAGVRVVVTAGAVALRATERAGDDGARAAPGRPGHAGRRADDGRARRRRRTEDVAWTRGRLVFRDAPLQRVAADLRRWYGVDLRAGDAPGRRARG